MCDSRSRLVSSAVFLGGHSANSLYVLYTLREGQDSLRDKRVADMKQQMFIFLTIWNVIFQIVYLILNIMCEMGKLKETKLGGLLGPAKAVKRVLFDSLMAPTTISIFIVFWPLFVYDRELLYPQYVDDAIGSLANYMMHAFILLVVVWEMRYISATEKYRGWCLINVGLLCTVYMAVLFHNYATTGLFPYPILHQLYGTVYLPLLLAACVGVLFATHHAQWSFRRLVSIGEREKSNKVK